MEMRNGPIITLKRIGGIWASSGTKQRDFSSRELRLPDRCYGPYKPCVIILMEPLSVFRTELTNISIDEE